MQHVGIYIAARRRAAGFTQPALAEAIGVSEEIVRAWEKGKYEPRIGTMRRLLHAINGAWSDIDQLLADNADVAEATRLAALRDATPAPTMQSSDQQLLDALRSSRLTSAQRDALIALFTRRDEE